ncbi:MAG TPA: beta-glucosidase BglX [Terriglobales bacterium]|nr:beta-glucosidase BglX [Terriglobales bacterium]
MSTIVRRISLLLLCLVPFAAAQQSGPLPHAEVNRRVEALLHQMTLQEKIGQLTQLSGNLASAAGAQTPARIRQGLGGSVLWLNDPAAINRLQHMAVDESRLHIPLLFGYDVIHGFHTTFPVPLAMAASWDPALVEQEQATAAQEASAAGIRWTFAPMVDIARDARWGRMVEGAGEDPYLGTAMARAQVRGFQGPYLGSPEHILACAKHFAGYGAAEGGRDYDSSYIPEERLRNVYFPPFHAALEAGVGSFMSAYMDLNDVPAGGNSFLLQDVLRRDWGFGGFVVSDAFAVRNLVTHGFARDPADAAYRALTAGVNMDMASATYLTSLPALVQAGKISMATIDAAVRPILAAKIRLGLFEHPYADLARVQQVLNAPQHRQLARIAAQRTFVLLRDENSLLPLKKNIGTLAVIGPLADSPREMLGSWTASADVKQTVTVLQGIRNKLGPGARVEYAPGPEIHRTFAGPFDALLNPHPTPQQTPEQAQDAFEQAVATARRADLVIMVLGEAARMSGEAASRASLTLPGRQQELLQAVAALGKPVVLVLVNGRPLDLRWASAHIPAILEAWYPGTEGGNAIADALFGDVNPGGKLPVSWPRSVGQEPLYYDHNLTHLPETSPRFTSRYWDEASSPLYPFGYGLSYTSFAFSNLRLSAPQVRVGEPLRVSVDVQNTGSRAGDEVVQLYIHQQAGSASRPVRELKGFQRVTLAPGAKKMVSFTLGRNELSFWSPQSKKWVEEAEPFDVWAGGDSTATLHATFKVVP